MIYARVQDGQVLEVVRLPDGLTLNQAFHEGLHPFFLPVPEETEVAPGWQYDGNVFLPPGAVPLDVGAMAAAARADRAARLAASDWAALVDVPLTASQRKAWASYRDALRAVPQQSGFPADIIWPAPPV